METFEVDFTYHRGINNLILDCVIKCINRLDPSLKVEHVGSTAIEGAITKGDFDVNIRVAQDDFKRVKDLLSNNLLIAQEHNWSESFASF